MSSSFFSDLDESPESQKQSSFFSDLDQQPSRTRSILSAFPKGAIKGAQDINPLPRFGSVPKELGLKLTEQFLPTQKGKAPEEILEFAGEYAPTALLGEGGLIKKGAQALAGGLAKKGAKELNLPEWAQEIVGAVGMSGPDIIKGGLSKVLKPSKKQSSVYEFLKSKGLSDKEITPIIQSPKKLSLFSKGASKFEEKAPYIKGIKEKLGNIFEDIREKGSKAGFLEGSELYNFEDSFQKQFEKVPRMYRGIIQKEVDDLFKNPINFKELHDFDKAVNAIVGNMEGGKAAVGLLKDPVKKAMSKMNPSLFSELQQTNHAYSRISDFADKMTKKNWEGLIKMGAIGKALLGVLTLNPAMIAGGAKLAAAVGTARYGLKQALINPRLQNIHSKMWKAFLKNDIPTALKLMENFNSETHTLESEEQK